jgi:uncharacterized iron-regulated membrane protein
LVSGLVVLILGITGCIYCFEKELRNVFYAEWIFVDEQHAPLLPLDSLHQNLPGLASYFYDTAEDERSHMLAIYKYLNTQVCGD